MNGQSAIEGQSAIQGQSSVGGRAVTVDPTATGTLVSTQTAAAQCVAERAVAERIDTATLVPTFGLIGAVFLAALNQVGAARSASLDALATGHAATAARTTAATAVYECADAASACGVGVPA